MIIETSNADVIAATLATTVTIVNPCYKGTESVNYIQEFTEFERVEIEVGGSTQVNFLDASDSVGSALNDMYFCGTRNF
jgi:hypothetical protein